MLAVTAGEPAGIGPDLCVMLAQEPQENHLVVIADRSLLEQRASRLRLPWRALPFAPDKRGRFERGALPVMHVPLEVAAQPGQLERANARYVLRTLETAADGCGSGLFDAMVTAPVHKGVINDGGFEFTGHTEFLAARTKTEHVVMMLVGGGLRVALATTHVPLRDVANHITKSSLERTLRILDHELRMNFGLDLPRIAVAGLNPHAGEGGHLGREEIDVIGPLLESLRGNGMNVSGPLPADTLFTPNRLRDFDCALAMYHDQGLPVLKYASFGGGVNVTLGLPIVRTSVDHGTALELAGSGNIDAGSMRAAIALAGDIARRRARPSA